MVKLYHVNAWKSSIIFTKKEIFLRYKSEVVCDLCRFLFAGKAQMEVHRIDNPKAAGSSPAAGTNERLCVSGHLKKRSAGTVSRHISILQERW